MEFGSWNADNSKIRCFVKLIWEQHHQSTFVPMVQYVIQNCLSFAADKQDTEFLTVWSCHRLPYKKFQFNCLWITTAVWTIWNFRDFKYLHVDGLFPLNVVNISCVLSQIPAYTINRTYFEWWYKYSMV